MSAHSLKAKSRHPKTTTFDREEFKVGHITIEVIDHPKNGVTWALIAGDALSTAGQRPLFTGHVQKGMGTSLRKLAHRFDDLESKIDEGE